MITQWLEYYGLCLENNNRDDNNDGNDDDNNNNIHSSSSSNDNNGVLAGVAYCGLPCTRGERELTEPGQHAPLQLQ